jgi:hypothetical protein
MAGSDKTFSGAACCAFSAKYKTPRKKRAASCAAKHISLPTISNGMVYYKDLHL